MRKSSSVAAKEVLDNSVTVWFITAVLGQWLFALYVLLFYAKATLNGHSENWNKALPHGYVRGDSFGNIIVGIHLMLAIIMIFGGPFQIVSKVRDYAPTFHRWNGRIYIAIAFVMSITGLFMVWIRGSIGGLIQHISISINAILIMVSAVMAIKYAMARNFKTHRIWAIRLFLLVNGVWFFRVGLFFWLTLNRKPVGFDPVTFEGPFLSFLSFSQYMIPLTIFELYLKSKKGLREKYVYMTSLLVVLLTAAMAIGILAISIEVWFPRMRY